MREFLEALKALVGRDAVHLNIYIPADASVVNDDSHFIWQGKIIEVNGRLLRFEHDMETKEKIGVHESLLNLDACLIWAVDLTEEVEGRA
ncbi:hypothetical protein H8E65_12175 [Candidatus Bathyarchaeota archaeon]|nr:hypothetical protein [Candidatus Bathyarchaeota archaeon]